jgi:hypothetical protein
MERLNHIINMDIAGQTNFSNYFGFCSLDESIKQPKQMIETCNESYQLHRSVRSLLIEKKESIKNYNV